MGITYIHYEAKLKDQVVSLLQKGFKKVAFPEAKFDWLHLKNPMAPSCILLALDKGNVVGFRAVIKKEIMINNTVYIGGRDIDPVVDNDYRGKGIFSMLLKKSLEEFKEIDIYFNFANKLSEQGFIKNQWHPLEYNNFFFSTAAPYSFSKVGLLSLASSFRKLLPFSKMNHVTSVRQISLSDFAANPQLQKREFPISVIKDSNYLNWRYNRADRSYFFYLVGDDKVGYGLIICRIDNDKCLIIDIINQTTLRNTDLLNNLFVHFKQVNYKLLISAWEFSAKQIQHSMLSLPKYKSRFFVREGLNRKFDIDIYNPDNWNMLSGESEFN